MSETGNAGRIERMTRVAVFLLFLLAISSAISEELEGKGFSESKGARVALIIGNSSYPEAPLSNPANDASDLADALEKKGFDVLVREDVGERGLKEAVDLFSKHLKKGGVGLFFFAGHGTQLINGENQLIPVDATFQKPEDILTKSVSAEHILDLMSNAGNRINIVILDACRNNPFDNKVSPTNHGLVAMTVRGSGTFISYATAPGSTASDGASHNGLFTQHLLKSLDEPGSDIEKVFARVRKGVYGDSNGAQLPSTFSSLVDNFYFDQNEEISEANKPPVTNSPVNIQQNPVESISDQSYDPAEEQKAWEKIKDSKELNDYKEYLNHFGASKNANFARFRFELLGGKFENEAPANVSPQESVSPAPVVAVAPNRNDMPTTTPNVVSPAVPVIPVASVVPAASAPTTISVPSAISVISDCPHCPELVVVPAGEFMMGANSGDFGYESDESPQHRVRIGQSLAVGKFEVTRGQFAAFVEDTGYRPGDNGCNTKKGGRFHKDEKANWRFPGFEQTETDPVVCVSWDDSNAYLDWLSKTTGKHYRLLSEAEWEYIARSPVIDFVRTEGEAPCHLFNIADASALGVIPGIPHLACSDDYPTTAPAGSFPANSFGVFDTLGNAWEWVGDCWNESYAGAPSDGGSWTQGRCGERVFRGGGWDSPPRVLRYTYRDRGDKIERYDDLGFRVVRILH